MASTYILHTPSPPLNAYIDHFYYLDIEKSDLALFLQFEILNYMGAAFNGS